MKDTLLVIPAYNEAANLPCVLKGLDTLRDEMDVLVIDDGSTDGTRDVARGAGVRCLSLPFNLGIGGALETAYKYAYRRGYRYVVRIDGDGQHEPKDIPHILEPVRSGEADFVGGSRFLGGDNPPFTNFSRRVGIGVFRRLIRRFTGQVITDPTSGFRAFNREVLRAFMHEYPTDFPEVETLLYLNRLGLRTREEPVRFYPRQGGRSSIDFWRSVYYMYKVTFAVLILTVRDYPRTRIGGEQP